MKLQTATFPFQLLTDCFSGTAGGKEADHSILRVPPIRGHIRLWHSKVFGANSCNEIWGSTAGNGAGSRVGIRLVEIPKPSSTRSQILPHKNQGPHKSVQAGTSATLEITRFPLCSDDQWNTAQRATKLWLVLGTLGLRSSRAAGSIWPMHLSEQNWIPKTAQELGEALTTLGRANYSVSLIGKGMGMDAQTLRTTASDTVSDLRLFGSIKPRTPSPTRFKVIVLPNDGGLCLLAIGPTPELLLQAEDALRKKSDNRRWAPLRPWETV
ncbi:MAG: hypothetical protein WCO60_17745 [Verrucomicrobiota bacterium]